GYQYNERRRKWRCRQKPHSRRHKVFVTAGREFKLLGYSRRRSPGSAPESLRSRVRRSRLEYGAEARLRVRFPSKPSPFLLTWHRLETKFVESRGFVVDFSRVASAYRAPVQP